MKVARVRLVSRTVGDLLVEEVKRARDPRGSLICEDVEWTVRQRERAVAVRRGLERLGPLYIKIGQMLSTRPDLVPEYMMAEFERLHDRVTPTPFSTFEDVLAEDLGPAWASRFQYVDPVPVGTASLAQVYRVVLQSGRQAVVKIQRPGIRSVVLDDMATLQWVVRRIAKRVPDFNDVLELDALLEVVFAAMRPELDFTLEAEQMDGFRERVEDFDTLHIPEVIHCTPRVLVMGLAPGVSIRDVDPDSYTMEQRTAMGTDLLAFQFWGFFVDGKFHADPHPGNIFISPDGEVSLIDWGMVAQVDKNLSTALAIIMLSMAMNDAHTLARTWIEIGRATRRADIAGFINDMARFIPGIAGEPLERFNFGVQLTKILTFSSKRGIATTPAIASLGKSFANIEGSVRYLAPHLSITEVFEDEFAFINQELSRELLSDENTMQRLAQAMLMLQDGPVQVRSVLADVANRDATVRVGEEMGRRSRREDRADERTRRLTRTTLGVALLALWLHRRRTVPTGRR